MQFISLNCPIPKRYIIVAMVFIGYANIYYLHSNLSMAVVEMTTVKNITHENGTIEQRADFNWNLHEKGVIFSTVAYGRLLSPIAGFLSARFGGSTIYGIGILIVSLLTFFSPFFLYIDFKLFVVTNVILGVFEMFSLASVTQLFSRWAPPNERAKFVSFSVIGANLGSGLSFIISGWILTTWKWEMLFYASGAASFMWYLTWIFVVKNDPSEDKRINEEERTYIEEKINCSYAEEKLIYPWKKILTCTPFWVGCLVKFVIGCQVTFTFMYVPQYIKDTSNIDIKEIGFLSMIPQIFALISSPIGGCISDYLRSHKLLTVTNIHKLFVGIGMFSSAASFLCIVLWPSLMIRIIAISVIQFCSTFTVTTILVLFLDLTPKYASFLGSVANVFFISAGIIIPSLVGFIVTSHSNDQWNICFVISSCLCLLVGILYLIFGSGKQRSWSNYNPKDESKQSNINS